MRMSHTLPNLAINSIFADCGRAPTFSIGKAGRVSIPSKVSKYPGSHPNKALSSVVMVAIY